MRTLSTIVGLFCCSMLLAQAPSGHASCCTPKAAVPSGSALVCKHTSAELNERKATVLASLKGKVVEYKELEDGYTFRFDGSDAMIDELHMFIQTERQCCGFFVFGLTVSGDPSTAWLSLTGPEGVKDVIHDELGLVP